MTRLLEQAFEEARELSPEGQDDLARTILGMVRRGEEGTYVLSREEREAIAVARRQVARGEYATEDEIEAIFKTYVA